MLPSNPSGLGTYFWEGFSSNPTNVASTTTASLSPFASTNFSPFYCLSKPETTTTTTSASSIGASPIGCSSHQWQFNNHHLNNNNNNHQPSLTNDTKVAISAPQDPTPSCLNSQAECSVAGPADQRLCKSIPRPVDNNNTPAFQFLNHFNPFQHPQHCASIASEEDGGGQGKRGSRKRILFSPLQVRELEEVYSTRKFINCTHRNELANRIGLTSNQVKNMVSKPEIQGQKIEKDRNFSLKHHQLRMQACSAMKSEVMGDEDKDSGSSSASSTPKPLPAHPTSLTSHQKQHYSRVLADSLCIPLNFGPVEQPSSGAHHLSHIGQDELFNEVVEVNRMLRQIPDELFDADPAETKWQKVFKENDSLPCLYRLLSTILSIQLANAFVERVFSLCKARWRDARNLLQVETVKALLQVRVNYDLDCAGVYQLLMKEEDLRGKFKSAHPPAPVVIASQAGYPSGGSSTGVGMPFYPPLFHGQQPVYGYPPYNSHSTGFPPPWYYNYN